MGWMRDWTRVVPVAIFALIAGFLAYGLTRDPGVIPSEMIDRPLPEFDLPDLRSETRVTRSSLLGQPALINVFGSWCVACLEEHPKLMQLTKTGKVRLVGVNWRDEAETALNWLDRHGDPYETIIFDSQSELAIELGVTGAPETFIIDAGGRIRYKQTGPITDAVWTRTIEPILKQIEAEGRSE